MHAETPFVGGGVGTGEVDGRAEVDHRAAGRQLGGDDLVIEGLAPARPPVTAGHHTRRAVVGAEVDERDQRCDLQLVVRAREVRPHVLVAMRDLGFRARTPRDQVTEVEAIPRAGRQQDLVADAPVGVMGHHLVGERRRDRGQRRDVLGAGPEEGLDHRVDGAHPGLGGGDRVGDFGVDRVDGRLGDESVDEDRAVGAEGVGDGRRRRWCRRSGRLEPRGYSCARGSTTLATCSRYGHAISGGMPPQSGMSMSMPPLRTISAASSVL